MATPEIVTEVHDIVMIDKQVTERYILMEDLPY